MVLRMGQNRAIPDNLQAFRAISMGVEIESSFGRSPYRDHPYSRPGEINGSAVWKFAASFNSWYQLTPRWSIGGSVGLHAKYFQLRTSVTVEDLSDDIGFLITTTSREYGLRRIRHYTSALNLGINSEYLLTPALSGPTQIDLFGGIGSGFALGTTMELRFYQIDSRGSVGGIATFLHPARGLLSEEQLPEQVPIENSFEDKLNPAPFIYQVGFVLYSRLPFGRNSRPRFRLKVAYTSAMQPLSTGFLHPYRGVSISYGTRIYRKKGAHSR